MAGNKHKNGIICMFPGCEKKMRTQKFKGHFVKSHLREGEEYNVDHRRQFEIAQAEPLADSDTASASASPMSMDLMGTSARAGTGMNNAITPIKNEPVKHAPMDTPKKTTEMLVAGDTNTSPVIAPEAVRASESDGDQIPSTVVSAVEVQAPAQDEQLQPTQMTTPTPASAPMPTPAPVPTTVAPPLPTAVPTPTLAPPSLAPATAVTILPAPVAAGVAPPSPSPAATAASLAAVRPGKRPASAMSSDVVAPPNGTPIMDESTMVKMLLLMDRRFNELTHKMDEMMEVQRLLLSAMVAKEASAVDEQATKKRKESTSTSMV